MVELLNTISIVKDKLGVLGFEYLLMFDIL